MPDSASTPSTPPPSAAAPMLSAGRGRLPAPIQAIYDLFSSVRFGITLLSILFVYSSVGSAGILYPISLNVFDLDNWDQIVPRQQRWAEMTEFEWFHWWPFNLLIALICLNITVTTLRRIRFRPVNYGVWMIHTGIIILALGSVWYFTLKVEGDAPIARRMVVIRSPHHEPLHMIAQPGMRVTAGEGDRRAEYRVVDIDPDWELLTGDAAGRRAYSVTVQVTRADRTFMRQLLAGHPDLTEDVLPGQGRAVRVTGEKLVDPDLSMSLEYAPQRYFYLAHSEALYLREVGRTEWVERPIHGLPRYNDSVDDYAEIWPVAPGSIPALNPLGIIVPPVAVDDPLPGMNLRIDSYLRYADLAPGLVSGGDRFDPSITLRLISADNQTLRVEMKALDPTTSNDLLGFEWVDDEREIDAHRATTPGRLVVEVPGGDGREPVMHEWSVPELELDRAERPFIPIEGTEYAIRVQNVIDSIPMESGPSQSAAIVEVKRGDASYVRFVSSDADRSLDQSVDAATGARTEIPTDPGIRMRYIGSQRPRLMTIVAGPTENRLRIVIADAESDRTELRDLPLNTRVQLFPNLSMVVDQYVARPRQVTRPVVVPREQRNRDLDMRLRMVKVEFEGRDPARPVSYWLPFHDYPFENAATALRRFAYRPTVVRLSDGRSIEVIFSRRRMELPAPVVLEDFVLEEHVGGFTGSNVSVRDWRSVIRFAAADGLTEPINVSVNKPGEFRRYWFFQSMWDPPDAPRAAGEVASRGRNYTVLGVGNREGVYTQLFGCIVAVIGMLYAFYVKPMIKRRKQLQAQATASTVRSMSTRATSPAREPALTGKEAS